jgi:hypothetical protein
MAYLKGSLIKGLSLSLLFELINEKKSLVLVRLKFILIKLEKFNSLEMTY